MKRLCRFLLTVAFCAGSVNAQGDPLFTAFEALKVDMTGLDAESIIDVFASDKIRTSISPGLSCENGQGVLFKSWSWIMQRGNLSSRDRIPYYLSPGAILNIVVKPVDHGSFCGKLGVNLIRPDEAEILFQNGRVKSVSYSYNFAGYIKNKRKK